MATSTAEGLIQAALDKFRNEPGSITIPYQAPTISQNIQVNCIQKVTLKQNPSAKTSPPKGDFYAYVWTTEAESKILKTKLADCAKLGLLVAVSKPVYAAMKGQDIRKARISVKEFTRHNDKLGFDYSITENGYYASYSKQFQESAYGGKDSFLSEAANFYDERGMRDTAEHFKKMNTMFNIPASSGVMSAFSMPNDISADRRIEGFQRQIDELQEIVDRVESDKCYLQQEIEANQKTIQGYQDSVVLSPHQVVDYPQKLRANLKKIMGTLQTTDETRYIKSLLDPFHPDCLGVRVPTRVPRNTITYNNHSEFTFKATSNMQDVIVISNFEQLSGDKYVAIQGRAVEEFLNNAPAVSVGSKVFGHLDGEQHDVTFVDIGGGPIVTVETDDVWHANFFKMRCVAGGMRIMKTSRQDSEAGSLDLIYSRDGSSFDEGHPFRVDLARTRPDRIRTYLAGTGCCLRGSQGFVTQTNKRPHDDASLDLLDVKRNYSAGSFAFAPMSELSSVWFIDIETNTLYKARDFAQISRGNRVGIVLESLQQRHTSMAIVQGIQSQMSLSFEVVYHMEGIADQSAYGFTQAHSAQLRSASTSLQLLDTFPIDMIFAPYSVRRPQLLKQILGQQEVAGFWDETLFPGIKELVRYGADQLSGSDFLEDVIDAVVDSAAGTLGYMAPAFMPAIMAASGTVKKPLHNLADEALAAAQEWTRNVGGQTADAHTIAVYGESVLDKP